MRRTAAAVAALPVALALDLCLLAVLIRGLHASRVVAITVGFALTVVAWALLSSVAGALLSRRGPRDADRSP